MRENRQKWSLCAKSLLSNLHFSAIPHIDIRGSEMKSLFFTIILTSACQSFSTDPKNNQRPTASDSMMHGWKFENHRSPMKGASTGGNAANGKKLYKQNCQKCHGGTGRGDGGVAKILDTRPADLTKSDFQHKRHFFYVISEGNLHGMPAWKSVLSNTQIADVIAYIKTLK